MNDSFVDIWIGCLPIGRDLDLSETIELLTSLPDHHNYILDLSDVYSNGMALSILTEICHLLPPNIHISLKLGWKSYFHNQRFTVDARSWNAQELYDYFCACLEPLEISRIHSFQLHALPSNADSVSHCISSIKRIKKDFSVDLGIANIDASQYLSLIHQLPKISFLQLHANIIEQRLVHEFSSIDHTFLPEYFIFNRVFCRGLLNDLNYVFNNYSSRFNVSNRVKSSLTDKRLSIINTTHELCNEFSISIHELALGFCFTSKIPAKPILGGKNLNQILHSISILDRLESPRLELISSACASLNSMYGDSILKDPTVAFER